MYILTAIALTPGGSSTAHIYAQTIYRTTQLISAFSSFDKEGRGGWKHELRELKFWRWEVRIQI
jgi:hypothetical protein